ncbi:MAG: WecB/TagA/CpsF family glycosyltransferase [Anaerolineae bacterium]|nr:WecB/TagA/CpsF family glycosyltransferase [Anaerolineae bacterium]
MAQIPRTNILGVGVSALNLPLALETIAGWIERRERHYVCVTNVHVVMECVRDPALRAQVNRAGLVTPDGMPLVWLSRRAGHSHVARVYGPDLMLGLCALSAERGYRPFFYGGAPGVAEALAVRMADRFPGLQVAGTAGPPFRTLAPAEQAAEIAQLNAARADILWVGLGAPRQERWMAARRPHLDTPVLIGVGAAFDFHTGRVRQAPRWMMRAGLEWLYRLGREPRRLWRRYLINNPWFVYNIVLQQLGLRTWTLETEDGTQV